MRVREAQEKVMEWKLRGLEYILYVYENILMKAIVMHKIIIV